MKSKLVLLNVFIATFVILLPGTGIINDFANALLAAYLGAAAVAFVYDNLPENKYKQLSLTKAKLFAAGIFIFGSPILLYVCLWTILAPTGFNQILVLLILAAIFYIPLIIVIWIIFWVAIALLEIN